MSIDPNSPAFPCRPSDAHKGLTIRQYIAVSVLQGMYSSADVLGAATYGQSEDGCDAAVVKQCFAQADALISHENA